MIGQLIRRDPINIQKIKSDIEFLGNNKLNKIRWFGGEFISGPPHFLENCIRAVKVTRKNIIKIIKNFFIMEMKC